MVSISEAGSLPRPFICASCRLHPPGAHVHLSTLLYGDAIHGLRDDGEATVSVRWFSLVCIFTIKQLVNVLVRVLTVFHFFIAELPHAFFTCSCNFEAKNKHRVYNSDCLM